MADPDPRQELAALAADVRTYVRYLGQIGDSYLSSAPEAHDATTSIAGAPSDVAPADQTRIAPVQPGVVQPAAGTLFGALRGVYTPPRAAEDTADDSLAAIRTDIGDCTRCKLHQSRTNIVFGEGNPTADLMFIGEGPGADEDATGRPFVGAAGQLLDRIIEAIGLTRDQVYIANVVKCRPPGNRAPERDEMATCEPFVFRQIAAINPKVIVLLGNTPVQSVLKLKGGITRLRGEFRDYQGIKVMPTFHPAYLLRDPARKRDVWEDMKKVKSELGL